ncbi:hypothetical protein K443DRAFT_676917 [Laccaria amethystina LaAM-08-1]|uniref:Unplaced genomic scaffold K443scaffold_47, whole genome shotgun sequence n=1 Tax=Laccaria amethystina LaAM-08-1 TaxID=1095629 RepID=A0A0C9XEB2_9AGAR|nr:hypothetical protein K443DRAFT_676917 [Laccaria amethystina LaAM-08-1]
MAYRPNVNGPCHCPQCLNSLRVLGPTIGGNHGPGRYYLRCLACRWFYNFGEGVVPNTITPNTLPPPPPTLPPLAAPSSQPSSTFSSTGERLSKLCVRALTDVTMAVTLSCYGDSRRTCSPDIFAGHSKSQTYWPG